MQGQLKSNLVWSGKQIIKLVSLLLCVSMAAFMLVSLSPTDPLQTNVGQTALGSMSPEQIEKLERYWGVDEPAAGRYISWLGDFVRGDMGTSLIYRRPVAEVIGEKLLNSIWMLGIAWLFSGIAGLALGIISGVNKGRAVDKAIHTYSLVTASTPAFWVALVLLLIFSVWLKIFPIGFSVPVGVEQTAVTFTERLYHAALPALTLCITGISSITLHTREKVIEIMESDYVLFAKARGETTWGIVRHHCLRNVLLPVVTLQFASIGEIIGGSIVVEQVFSYPGIGQAAVDAGLGGDVPLLLGVTVITSAVVFLGNLAANLLYHIIDPRIRRGGA